MLALAPDWAHETFSIPAAHASSFVELSLGELVAEATVVVRGTPLDARSLWEESDRGRRIVTYTRVRVDQIVDGRTEAQEVWIRTLGGHVGDIGQHVDGEAVLVPAQEGLLFLRSRPDGTHSVVGMAQGLFPLEAARAGEPARLFAPRALGNLLARRGAPAGSLPARVALAGRTLEEASRLIVLERQSHAK